MSATERGCGGESATSDFSYKGGEGGGRGEYVSFFLQGGRGVRQVVGTSMKKYEDFKPITVFLNIFNTFCLSPPPHKYFSFLCFLCFTKALIISQLKLSS